MIVLGMINIQEEFIKIFKILTMAHIFAGN